MRNPRYHATVAFEKEYQNCNTKCNCFLLFISTVEKPTLPCYIEIEMGTAGPSIAKLSPGPVSAGLSWYYYHLGPDPT